MLTNIAIILTNAFQQLAGQFVLGILRHQLAAKGFGERGRNEFSIWRGRLGGGLRDGRQSGTALRRDGRFRFVPQWVA